MKREASKPNRERRAGRAFALAALTALPLLFAAAPRAGAQDAPFLRGDANQDGTVSLSDMVAIRRWLFGFQAEPACLDAADFNDDERVNITDMVGILNSLFFDTAYTSLPPGPFPEPGVDPTSGSLDCGAYAVQPAEQTDDVLSLGEVEGAPGEEVLVPVYLSPTVPVDAVQLVVKYDPLLVEIPSGGTALTYEGTFYEQFLGKWFTITYNDGHSTSSFLYPDAAALSVLTNMPESGLFTAAIAGHIAFSGFEVPPGDDVLIAWIRMKISPEAPPDTVISLTPTNGPDGLGTGMYHLKNELTYKGEARYVSILPHTEPGTLRVGIVGDITFFIRGDANRDEVLDISDAISILNFLFLGGEASTCPDATDADDNGDVDMSDAITILNHLFLGGDPLPAPFPDPGVDPTLDAVGGCRK